MTHVFDAIDRGNIDICWLSARMTSDCKKWIRVMHWELTVNLTDILFLFCVWNVFILIFIISYCAFVFTVNIIYCVSVQKLDDQQILNVEFYLLQLFQNESRMTVRYTDRCRQLVQSNIVIRNRREYHRFGLGHYTECSVQNAPFILALDWDKL